jgi:diadenosine tetraphosphate (Ap4A) HIT family hydrolase
LTSGHQCATRLHLGRGLVRSSADRAGTHLPLIRPDVSPREGPRSSRVVHWCTHHWRPSLDTTHPSTHLTKPPSFVSDPASLLRGRCGTILRMSPPANDGERCEACSLATQMKRNGKLALLTERWSINPAKDWTSRPWFVIQPIAHRESLGDLNLVELTELGSVLSAVSCAIEDVVAPERIYIILFNELDPPHIHFHLVCRLTEDPPQSRGPALIGTPAPGPPWSPKIAADVVTGTRRRLEKLPASLLNVINLLSE